MEPQKKQKSEVKKKVRNKNWDFHPNQQSQNAGQYPLPKTLKYPSISQLALKYTFKVQSIIGSGFASTVYVGSNIQTNQFVCIKAIDLMALGMSPKYIDLINKQIATLKKINSSFVVKLFDIYESNTFYYLVMQLCPGYDLYKMLKLSPIGLPTRFINCLIRQICQGLKQIHSYGIIHRDLKTQNIFIKEYPKNPQQEIKVKIGDLGFCIDIKELQDLLKENKKPENVGSPIYMSPEISLNSQYSFGSDIYGLGIIWYELYHKKAPWQAISQQELLQKKMTKQVSFWRSDIQDPIKNIIRRCLSNDPKLRPTCDEIIALVSIQQKL